MRAPRTTSGTGSPPARVQFSGSLRGQRIVFAKEDWVFMDGVDFVRVDLSRQRGSSLHVAGGSRFVECDFSNVRFRNSAQLGGRDQSVYERCSFDGAALHGCGANVRMVGCTFRNARLTDWFGTALELVDCQFDGCKIERSKFWGRPHGIPPNVPDRPHNEFVGNDFSRADLRGVSFAGGIDLTKQKMPLARNYLMVRDLAVAIDRARAAVALWADDGPRTQALGKLRGLDETRAEGQDQALIDLREWNAIPTTTMQTLVDLLQATPTS